MLFALKTITLELSFEIAKFKDSILYKLKLVLKQILKKHSKNSLYKITLIYRIYQLNVKISVLGSFRSSMPTMEEINKKQCQSVPLIFWSAHRLHQKLIINNSLTLTPVVPCKLCLAITILSLSYNKVTTKLTSIAASSLVKVLYMSLNVLPSLKRSLFDYLCSSPCHLLDNCSYCNKTQVTTKLTFVAAGTFSVYMSLYTLPSLTASNFFVNSKFPLIRCF